MQNRMNNKEGVSDPMIKQVYEIPNDVMADVAHIILQAGLTHRLTDAGRESVKMELLFAENNTKAEQQIKEIINDYNFFRYGDTE